MNSHSTLISIGQFDLKLNHLLIIAILSLSFSISFLIRSQPAEWGWELNEFDPFFNYRATEYIVENGFDAYFQWHDELSWYPNGRDVSLNSQVILHITAATTYWIFGMGQNLYDFTILFPVVFGSLTSIVIFALVRTIGGTTTGLFASLFFSISIPIIVRGSIGWFKSEPLGLFFGTLAVYLFLSGINSNNKVGFVKLISAGIFLTASISSWGGSQFFIITLAIFIFTLPLLRKNGKFLIWAIPFFTISTLVTSLGFERLGSHFVSGLGGLALIFPTIFLIVCIFVQNKSKDESRTKNGLFVLVAFLIIGSTFLIVNGDSNYFSLPSYRYLNALNPFLTTSEPLVDSVSEHATTSIEQSFLFHSIIMIFAGVGIWVVLKNSKKNYFIKNDMISFSLIIGLIGVYIASAFIRLEVFASLSVIMFSSIGISFLINNLTSNSFDMNKIKNFSIKSSFCIGLIILLVIPLVLPSNSTIFAITDNPPTIVNGGTSFSVSSNDWSTSLAWIKNNTNEDSVIAAWWDYGYWIQTKADRATLADNSTLSTGVIKAIAEIMLSNPDEGWKRLQDWGADYFIVFVAAQELKITTNDGKSLYILQGGGDESKKHWFMQIANEPLDKYLHSDMRSGTEFFWNETLFGKMIPFELLGYVHPQTNEQSFTYKPGFTAIYTKNVKFSEDGNSPFKLVYSSPSYNSGNNEITGVMVYEINKNYVPLD